MSRENDTLVVGYPIAGLSCYLLGKLAYSSILWMNDLGTLSRNNMGMWVRPVAIIAVSHISKA